MCVIDDFQHLRFGNKKSSDKFTGNPKKVSYPTSPQEGLKQQINIYIYIAYRLRGQWHSPVSPQTAKKPFLDIYFFPLICPTHIRPSCLTTKHPPNALQGNLSTILLQDVTQLINIGQTHILFDHAVFKTDLFLKYRETTGTFCSTSVNPVSQSLKSVMLEISSQVTNLHSDINGHQNTSMYFLCSNFFKSMIML